MKNKFELWRKIFEIKKYSLRENLHFVTANEIKQITGQEPRIMAKMDYSIDLPPIFRENGYFLLPVENGKYAIVRGKGFHNLEPVSSKSKIISSKIKFGLTTASRGSSEMQFIDYSFNAGAIEQILNIGSLYQSIRGREFTKPFDFLVNKNKITTKSVQIEVDAGFEGENSIVLLEAKIGTPKDFIIRQLFYPYNNFKIISPNKEIIPVFFTYDLKIKTYNLWIYKFTNHKNYNSIKLVNNVSFKIVSRHEYDINDIKPIGIVKYKDLIPQANSINKIIELVFKVSEGLNNYIQIAEYFKFDRRQSSYYREAAEALGLIEIIHNKYELTDIARQLIKSPVKSRNYFMVELLYEFNLIKLGIQKLKKNKILTIIDLRLIIAKNSDLNDTTVRRRSGSLAAWFRWIANTTGMFQYNNNKFYIN